MPGATTITHRTVFIVEGQDDQQFFTAMLSHLGINNRAQIIPVDGFTNIRPYLRTIKLTPGFPMVESLCVIRDADADATAALASIQHALVAASFVAPTAAFTIATGKPNTAIIVLPDGTQGGTLEDLCLQSVARGQTMSCVKAFGACLASIGASPTQRSKTLVQAYLASLQRTAYSVGNAAKNGYWPWADPAFAHLSSFLRQVVV